MIPRCYPRNPEEQWLIADVDTTGLTKWVDYIPVEEVADVPASSETYNNDGFREAFVLASTAGLTAWTDYTPVDIGDHTAKWRSDNDGFIPIVDNNV